MDLNNIKEELVIGVLLLVITNLLSGFLGFFKGKKKSVDSIKRKDDYYEPLIEHLTKIINNNLLIENISSDYLAEIISKDYRYAFDKGIEDRLIVIYNLLERYNSINYYNIADNIFYRQLVDGYTELYGTIIDGYISHCEPDGNEWKEEVDVPEITCFIQSDNNKYYKELYMKEGCKDYLIGNYPDICYETYQEVVNLYSSILNLSINGKSLTKRNMIINWEWSSAEYIATRFDFFEVLNSNKDYIEKINIKKSIDELSAEVVEDLKEIVRKIVIYYEKEVI